MKAFLLAVLFGLTSCLSICAQTDENKSYDIMRAEEFLNEGKREEAFEHLDKEIRNNPKSYHAYSTIANVYFLEGDYHNGMAYADTALMYCKKKYKESMAEDYYIRGIMKFMTGDTIGCIKDHKAAVKLMPKKILYHEILATSYRKAGMFEQSEKECQTMIKLDPEAHAGYISLARLAIEREDYEKALTYASQAEEHDAKTTEATNTKGYAYLKIGDYQSALSNIINVLWKERYEDAAMENLFIIADSLPQMVEDSIKRQYLPSNDEYINTYWRTVLGAVYENNEEYEKSISVFLKLQKDFPNYAPGFIAGRLGALYYYLDIYEPAIYYLTKSIEYGYNVDESDYGMRAWAYFETGQFKKAEDDFRKTMDYDTNNEHYAYYCMGAIKEIMDNYEGALGDYSNGIILNPNYSRLHYRKAILLKKHFNKPEEAKAEFEKAIELEQKHGEIDCSMYAYVELGDNAKGKAIMDSILVANPDDSGKYYDAACLHCRMGDNDAALDYLHTAFEKGFTQFAHIEYDDDVDSIRNTDRFREMMSHYKAAYDDKLKKLGIPLVIEDDSIETDSLPLHATYDIPINKRHGDTYDLTASVNGIPMNFVLDTGCSDISISDLEYNFLRKNGSISDYDERGFAYYTMANGKSQRCRTLNLREVKVGDLTLRNVRASVTPNQEANLLLGQSVFSKVGKVEIDNEKKMLRISK